MLADPAAEVGVFVGDGLGGLPRDLDHVLDVLPGPDGV